MADIKFVLSRVVLGSTNRAKLINLLHDAPVDCWSVFTSHFVAKHAYSNVCYIGPEKKCDKNFIIDGVKGVFT